jgi:DNA-binding GntR family transcriptional regulator
MAAAAGTGDRLGVADGHRAFHVALAALSGNRQLSLVYESVLLKIQLYMALNLRREAETTASPMDGVRRHRRLLRAIEGGDRAAILRELAAHGGRSYLT